MAISISQNISTKLRLLCSKIEDREAASKFGRFEDILLFPCGLAYVTVPKAANTTIKHYLASRMADWAPKEAKLLHDDPQVIHQLLRSKFRIDREELSRRVLAEDVVAFSVVRDPIERFLSFYNDKILRNGWSPDVYDNFRAAYGLMSGDPLSKVANVVSRVPDSHSEIHFRSQRSLLFEDDVPIVQHIFRMDNIGEMWEFVNSYCCLSGAEGYPDRKYNTSVGKDCFATKKIIKKLRKRYQKDCATFGY